MMAERLLKPRYRVAVIDLQKFEPEGIIGAFKRKGAHVSPLSGELDPGLAVDAFLSSSYGDYVYVLKFNGRTFLARHTKPIKEKNWKAPKRYMVRDESGLRRILLQETSKRAMLLTGASVALIWGTVLWFVWMYLRGNPFATFLMFFLGFLLTDVEKVLQYLTLGYCRE